VSGVPGLKDISRGACGSVQSKIMRFSYFGMQQLHGSVKSAPTKIHGRQYIIRHKSWQNVGALPNRPDVVVESSDRAGNHPSNPAAHVPRISAEDHLHIDQTHGNALRSVYRSVQKSRGTYLLT
jgi:hypothetical protein